MIFRTLKVTFEVVFLGYFFGIAAFSREFAHLHITVHGIPVFVGELALLTLTTLAAAIHLGRRRLPFDFDFAAWALLFLLGAGAVLAVRGLLLGFGLAVLRDFALVYYSWFFFLTLSYLEQGGAPRRVLSALLAGAVVGSCFTTVRFFAFPALTWGHGTAGHTGLYAWIAIIIVLAGFGAHHRLVTRASAAAAILACTFVVYLSGYRTLGLVVAVSLAVATALAFFWGAAAPRRFVVSLWAAAVVMGTLILVPRLMIPQTDRFVVANGPTTVDDALATVAYRWTSDRYGFWLAPTDAFWLDETGSLAFRSLAWRHALQRIRASPWTGIGFGPQAILHPESDCDTLPSPTSNCGSAHNTYLTLAMRMGIPSALLLIGVLGWLLARAGGILARSGHDPVGDPTALTALIALVSFLVFGLTSLLFESPYLSSVVWVLGGLLADRATSGDIT